MPFNLPLPRSLRKALWKVKIRDKEGRESPHVTILWKTKAWRIDLRSGDFMDREPDPLDVPDELIAFILAEANWNLLCEEWDRLYPANPVRSNRDAGGNNEQE